MKVNKLNSLDLADITVSDGVIRLEPYCDERFEDIMDTERQDPFTGCFSCTLDDIEEAKKLFFTGKERVFAIIRESDGAFAGYCLVHDITKKDWEIGVSLRSDMQGKGFGAAAMKLLLEAIEQVHKGGIVGIIKPDNYASIRLVMKVGATPKGLCAVSSIPARERKKVEREYQDLVNGNLVALAQWFGVSAEKLLTHDLVFNLKDTTSSLPEFVLSNQKRRVTLLHKAYEKKGVYDMLKRMAGPLGDLMPEELKDLMDAAKAKMDESFAKVREL